MDKNLLEFSDSTNEQKYKVDRNGADQLPSRTRPFLVEPVQKGQPPRSFTSSIPKSDLFTRINEFLPKLKQANEELQHRSAEEINIEHVSKGERHIKMELGLGVFNLEDPQNKENISLNEPETTSCSDDLTSSEESSEESEADSCTNYTDNSDVNRAIDDKHVLIEDITNLR